MVGKIIKFFEKKKPMAHKREIINKNNTDKTREKKNHYLRFVANLHFLSIKAYFW